MRRRDFLHQTIGASAAIGLPYFVPAHVLGNKGKRQPNDRLRVGFIGAGGRAQHLMIGEKLSDEADIVAMADCFLPRCEKALARLPDNQRQGINVYQDYRRMLEREKLDAVFVPTTTHARALICIHAMQAGLDVYAEKPISLTVSEGRSLCKAVKHYKRVFQAGTQQRSIPINRYASKLIREGAIGKVHTVEACNFISPEVWEPKPAMPMPEGLDWDLWCNQTELRPYHELLHIKWARWRSYDGGGISYGVTGWGTHALDQVQCALGTDDTGPVEIWPEGPDEKGRIKVTMRYKSDTLLKMHNLPRLKNHADLGAIFKGDKGTIEIIRGQCFADPPELLKDAPEPTREGPGEAVMHLKNFFDCVRSRKKPNADVETAHRATILCQLMNMCRRCGRKLKWDPEKERFQDDPDANKLLSRPRRKGYEIPEKFRASTT